MTTPLSILGLFCEDIREESGEILTLVGLMPDTVNVEVMPEGGKISAAKKNRFLNNLCVFVRANFDPNDSVEVIALTLAFPDDSEIQLGDVPSETIKKAKMDALERGLPLSGVIFRGVLAGFRIKKSGVVRLIADIGGEKRTLAMLNFQLKQPTSANGS
jgi:hypothetical protein